MRLAQRILVCGLALASLGVVGCGDLYYQTRYIPVSSESTYSTAEQATWSGDREVYELPAAPPAIDGLHRERIECAKPGQRFKPQAMVGVGGEERHHRAGEPRAVAGVEDLSPGNPLPPAKGYPVAAWGDPDPKGARERIGQVPVGGKDTGPFPYNGESPNPVRPVGGQDHDRGWCPPGFPVR